MERRSAVNVAEVIAGGVLNPLQAISQFLRSVNFSGSALWSMIVQNSCHVKNLMNRALSRFQISGLS